MPGWFDEHGFSERPPGQEGNRGDGQPANYGMAPTYEAMAPANPMTPEEFQARMNDPNNARIHRPGDTFDNGRVGASSAGQEPFSEAAFRDLVQSYPPTNEGVRAAYEAAKARWGDQTPELLEHPHRLDKFRFADGRVVDFIGGAGGPNPTHVWNFEGPGHGGGGFGGFAGGGNWQAGIDPSYGFVKEEAQKALQSGAAARGTLLTGGFQKDMAKYMAGLASQEFGNVFGRNMQLANLGLNAAGQSAGVGSAYSGQAGNLTGNQANTNTDLITGAGNAQAGATVGNAVGWGNTIGQLGNVLAPSAADWLKRPRRYPMDERIGPGSGGGPGAYGTPWGSSGDGY